LERLIVCLESSELSDVVFFNCIAKKEICGETSERCNHYRALIESWPASKQSIAFFWPVPWGKAIKLNEVILTNNLKFSSRIAGNDMEFSAKVALARPKISVFSEDVYVCYESVGSLTGTLSAEKALDRLKANINRNRLYYSNNVDFVHYNYCGRFFLKAMPSIVQKREFSVVWDAIKNFFISLRMNFLSK